MRIAILLASSSLSAVRGRLSRAVSLALRCCRRLAVPLAAACLSGCAAEQQPAAVVPHRGPIVLITVDALRADVVGGLGGLTGLTPHLDAMAGEATWAGRAVSSSSWTVPAMASIFTGLQPWSHQAIHAGQAKLRSEHLTLAEALKDLGFTTHAYRSNNWLSQEFGYDQGFDHFRRLRQSKRAVAHLESLDGSPTFVWIHVLPPHAPYVDRDELRPALTAALGEVPDGLPPLVKPIDLEPFYDPATPWPEKILERYWALYCANVLWADSRIGELIAALRQSGHFDDTLLVITSDHGEEFGEAGQSGHGGNLTRALIEVPLIVNFPAGSESELHATDGVATVRLWSTLVEAAGGSAPLGTAASLLHEAVDEAFSELYLGNGVNSFSLVAGGHRLHWQSQFGPGEPDFYRARQTSLGAAVSPPLLEPAEAIFERLSDAFLRTPPLSGNGKPELRLERWTESDAIQVADRARVEAMVRRIRDIWMQQPNAELTPGRVAAEGPDLTPRQVEQLKALGYIAE